MWIFWSSLAHAGPGTVLLSVDDVDRLPAVPIGARVVRCFRSSRVCLVEGGDPDAFSHLPGVRRAEHDAVMVQASGVTAEPTADCPDPYELAAIEVQPAWDQVCGANGPVMAIEDSGFRSTHHDLVGRVADQWDYGDDDPKAEVSLLAGVPEHGTFIAGILAATANDAGRTGIAPEGSLFLQKIADSDGALYFSYAIAAMDDLAINHPEVGVMNYSIAANAPPAAFRDAVEALGEADIVVVAAAANCSYGPNCYDADNDVYPKYPASYPYPHVLAVASLKENGKLDGYSHYGKNTVDVAAPGADLCSLGIDDDDQVLISSGTSFATPVAAGVVALVRERWPRLRAADAVQAVVRSCIPDPALTDRIACGGSVSADRALRMPVAAFDPPADLELAPTGTLSLTGDSRAAGGELFVAITIPENVAVDDATSFTAFKAGDEIPFPGGSETADAPGIWGTVPLPEDGPVTVEVPLVAAATGIADATVRAVPFAGDLVGAESGFTVAVGSAVPTHDTPTTGTPPTTDPTPADPAKGCGCTGIPTDLGPEWMVLGAVLAFRRTGGAGRAAARKAAARTPTP